MTPAETAAADQWMTRARAAERRLNYALRHLQEVYAERDALQRKLDAVRQALGDDLNGRIHSKSPVAL